VTNAGGPALAVSVRPAAADEWAVLRDIRLAALSEAPYAFGSTYEREAAFTERDWRGRISARTVTLFGYAGPGEPAGLAGVVVEDGAADLVSMYVRPGARGLGVGLALIDAAADWARSNGHRELYLWVTESNGPAVRLYARCGFTPTGGRQPLPSDPALPEIQLRRSLQ
jgi:GNAT superfamily N-acetyltransferase